MSCNVAFIGLGVMGYPMAGYISKGGHNVTVYNRTKSKAEKWINEYNGKINSDKDKPSQVMLNARPLVFSKNLDIVVVAVWDISPCPDNLIKKIEKNKKITDEILENKKQEIANKTTT